VNRVRVLRRARIAVYVATLAALAYLFLRYDRITLPSEGCSPVLALDPGSRALVDTWADGGPENSVLFFRDPEDAGTLLIGVVGAVPSSAPADEWEAVEGGALWLVSDRLDCPGRDSRVLGPIPRALVSGRVVFSWD
jgi:hypothetical protein